MDEIPVRASPDPHGQRKHCAQTRSNRQSGAKTISAEKTGASSWCRAYDAYNEISTEREQSHRHLMTPSFPDGGTRTPMAELEPGPAMCLDLDLNRAERLIIERQEVSYKVFSHHRVPKSPSRGGPRRRFRGPRRAWYPEVTLSSVLSR